MPLFGQLDDNIFLIFSRGNRHFYARVIVDLFDRFFSDTVTFPGRADVIAAIYDTLRTRPDLWTEEEDFSDVPELRARGRRFRRAAEADGRQDLLLDRAHIVYAQLRDRGWLDEESYGIRTTVDMPPAAMLLAERLAAIEKGLATTFRGVVITIRNALASVQHDPRANAVGLNKAAELAIRFSRELRAVLSHLRSIERDILNAENLNQRLTSFFQDFIGRLVLKDFESIYKTNHPYRYKNEILGYTEELTDINQLRDGVLEGYVDGELAKDRHEASDLLDADLHSLRIVFDNIDQTYDRINTFRSRLEARLRNTVRYAEFGDHRHSQHLTRLIVRVEQAVAAAVDRAPPWLADNAPQSLVVRPRRPWASHLLAEPRAPRVPVVAGLLRRSEPDPILLEWHALQREYTALFFDDLGRVVRFLEARIPPGAMAEARFLTIETIDDFLAFEHLRRLRHAPPAALEHLFAFEQPPDASPRNDAWIRCENFLIRRSGEVASAVRRP
jgi:hypothetical protein